MAETAGARIDGLLEGIAGHRKVSGFASVKRWARMNPIGVMGLVLILILVAMALSDSTLATHDPNDINAPANLGIGPEHYMGTDPIGKDVFSRLLFGARISLAVGLASVLLGVTGGALLGLFTGYIGGKTDLVVQRFIDAKIAIPRIILALTLMAIMGASATNVVIALAIGYVSSSTRVTRSVVLREKQKVYVDAARAIGASSRRIMLWHILPNSISPYLVLVSVDIGSAIIAEASLSFLGAGVGPDTPSWGSMLAVAAQSYFDSTPMLAIGPGVAITAAVLGFNLFGDAIRDTLDPRLRGG